MALSVSIEQQHNTVALVSPPSCDVTDNMASAQKYQVFCSKITFTAKLSQCYNKSENKKIRLIILSYDGPEVDKKLSSAVTEKLHNPFLYYLELSLCSVIMMQLVSTSDSDR